MSLGGNVSLPSMALYFADNLNMMLTPTQSIIIQGIDPSMKQEIEDVVHARGVKLVEEIDPLTRLSIACPALPMCGLAINEVRGKVNSALAQARLFFATDVNFDCYNWIAGREGDATLRGADARLDG